MFEVDRSYPAPESLALEKTKSSGKYNKPDVLYQLRDDFYNKCYLCEQKELTSINIEHFVAHRGDVDLKFNWDNLYWSCTHCNNIKSDKYNNLLDCTKDDAVNSMEYEYRSFPKPIVTITAIRNSSKTVETVDLLNKIYEGTTIQKKIEAESIRAGIGREIKKLNDCLGKDMNDQDVSNQLTDLLSKKSEYSAFKRWIILQSKSFNHLSSCFD